MSLIDLTDQQIVDRLATLDARMEEVFRAALAEPMPESQVIRQLMDERKANQDEMNRLYAEQCRRLVQSTEMLRIAKSLQQSHDFIDYQQAMKIEQRMNDASLKAINGTIQAMQQHIRLADDAHTRDLEAIHKTIDAVDQHLQAKLDQLNTKIDGVMANLSKRFDDAGIEINPVNGKTYKQIFYDCLKGFNETMAMVHAELSKVRRQ